MGELKLKIQSPQNWIMKLGLEAGEKQVKKSEPNLGGKPHRTGRGAHRYGGNRKKDSRSQEGASVSSGRVVHGAEIFALAFTLWRGAHL